MASQRAVLFVIARARCGLREQTRWLSSPRFILLALVFSRLRWAWQGAPRRRDLARVLCSRPNVSGASASTPRPSDEKALFRWDASVTSMRALLSAAVLSPAELSPEFLMTQFGALETLLVSKREVRSRRARCSPNPKE